MSANYVERLARAQESLREQRLVAAVFAPSDQMRYLTGWAEPGHERLIALFVPAVGDPVFVVPSINAVQALQNPAGITDVRVWEDSVGWHGVVRELLESWEVRRGGLAVDDDLLSVHLLGIQKMMRQTACVPAGDLIARLREIKDAEELNLLARSAAVTDAVYEECLASLHEGITELELQEAIAEAYRRRGTRPAFAIVCFGANSALPHHRTGNTPLTPGDVVVLDIGCALDDYASDITRTVAFGEPGSEAKRVYKIVYAAHRAAFEAGHPGVPCEEVDRAARGVITDAGYGEQFIHRTGHGIGLAGHETPYIVAGNRQPLAEGMCFSIEPGIYLPGRFGVRIENIVTVAEDGLRYLNADPPAELPVIET